eukprot:scaffold443_cov125-Cylindrotheca_fusiformis.AAC.25
MSRPRFFCRVGTWGILILFCVALNLLAAWNAPIFSSDILRNHGMPSRPRISETSLWSEVLRRQGGCGDANAAASSFSQRVRMFVADEQTGGCFVPQSSSCHVTKVSAFVLSNGKDLRTLFLNLLTFISYSTVDSITLFAKVDPQLLSKDPKYGQRIIEWDKRGTIKLTSVRDSLWAAVEQAKPYSEAVVWFNGDRRKNWTVAGIKTSLQLWKENSRALVGSQVLTTDKGYRVPLLHNLLMSSDYLCYLRHPLFDAFQHIAEDQDSANNGDSIALLWSFLASGNMIIANTRQNQIVSAEGISARMIDFFGCSLQAQPDLIYANNASNTNCRT